MIELRQREPRVRCAGYLAWLRTLPCCCGCSSPPPSEAAHIRSGSWLHGKKPTGMQEKPDDRWALPLRHAHHMRQHAHGSEIEWWSAHGIDPFSLAIRYYGEYQATTPRSDRQPRRKKEKFAVARRKNPWPKRKFW